MLSLQPIDFKGACDFITEHHRHHLPPQGWKFGIAVNDGEQIRGVIMVGRPVARRLDDGKTLEVTRCCTDGAKNAASKLYGAAVRAALALGYQRVVTYTLKDELGVSVVASGFKAIHTTPGKSWSCPSRPRKDKHPLGQKVLWEYANSQIEE